MADVKVHRGFLDQKPSPANDTQPARIEDDPLIELARIVSESAANLGRLGTQPGDEPTVLLNRPVPRPAMPQPETPPRAEAVPAPVSAPVPRAVPTPVAAPQPRKSVADFEQDLLAELRQSVEPLRTGAAKPAATPPAPLDDFDDGPTIALPLRGGAATVPPARPMPLDDAFDDLFSDAAAAAQVPPAPAAPAAVKAVAEKPACEAPRAGDNFPRPAIERLGLPGGERPAAALRAADARSGDPKVERRPVSRPKAAGVGRGLVFAGTMLGVVVIGGLGFLGWRAYAGLNANEPLLPPVIKADNKPVKVKADPQQVAAVDTAPKLTADRVEGDTKLVTRQEDPVDQVSPGVRRIVPGAPGTAAPVIEGDQPRSVKTVVVRPDGTVEQQTTQIGQTVPKVAPVPQPPVPAQPQAVVPQPQQPGVPQLPPPVAKVQPKATPDAPAQPNGQQVPPTLAAKTTIPQGNGGAVAPKLAPQPAKPAGPVGAPLALGSGGGQQAAPVPPAAAQPRVALNNPPEPQPVAPAASSGGGGDFMVQLSSQRTDADARKAFSQAQSKFGALAGKSLDVQRADLGARGTFYRVRVAGGSQDQAAALCAQIKSAGGDCVVTKR